MTFFIIFAWCFFNLNIVANHKSLTPAGPLCSKVYGKKMFSPNELSNSKPAVNRQPGFRRRDS